jgi:hypothetical protein
LFFDSSPASSSASKSGWSRSSQTPAGTLCSDVGVGRRAARS